MLQNGFFLAAAVFALPSPLPSPELQSNEGAFGHVGKDYVTNMDNAHNAPQTHPPTPPHAHTQAQTPPSTHTPHRHTTHLSILPAPNTLPDPSDLPAAASPAMTVRMSDSNASFTLKFSLACTK